MIHSPQGRVLRLLSHLTRHACGQSDAQLLQRFVADHDETAFEALLRRHGGLVWGVCRRAMGHEQDAEDVFQATFVVLARQASQIRKPEALASWLHGTALRMAQRARREMTRRKKHETEAVRAPAAVSSETTVRELQMILDEEVTRLPENYRAAFTLCVLEGRAREEAAAVLGCEPSTMAVHLCRARQRLKRQLARRGVALSSVLILATLTRSADAAVPALVRSTTLAIAARSADVSTRVAGLIRGATSAMFTARQKGMALVLLTTILFGAGLGVRAMLAQPVAAERPDAADVTSRRGTEKPKAKPREAEELPEVRGRVVDPDGKPAAGAKIYLVGGKPAKAEVVATADADGKFRFTVKPHEPAIERLVVAVAKGYGPDWIDLTLCEREERVLRLRKDDVPFVGRVVTLEGQPVVGATVEIDRLGKQAVGEELKPWIDNNVKLRKESIWVNERGLVTMSPSALGMRLRAVTDKDGNFRLTGTGSDRVLAVRVTGERIEHKFFRLVTRADAPKDGYIKTGDLNFGLYGPEMTILVGPAKPVVGTVRDRRTGKPVAGIKVEDVHGGIARAVTDAEGRYRLEGVPKKSHYALTAAGEEGVPYFDRYQGEIKDTAGFDPITVDFAMDRGIEITGRILDKKTGRPIAGQVHYDASRDNPHLKDYSDRGGVVISAWGRVRADGSYTVLAIPGQGAVSVCAVDLERYPILDSRRELWKLGVRSFPSDPAHAVLAVNLDPKKAASLVCNVQLTPGQSRSGKVLDADAKPLKDVEVVGVIPGKRGPQTMASPEFTVTGLGDRKRILIFRHRTSGLGGIAVVDREAKEPITVKLQPLGSIEGKVVDTDGKPWPGLKVTCRPEVPKEDYDNLPDEITTFQGASAIHRGLWHRFLEREVVTDREGRFRIEERVPGVTFTLHVSDGDLRKDRTLVLTRSGVRIEPGKANDLGELKPRMSGKEE
jgi:RNA polymerase sigma factor (sigma-70 family)